MFHIRLMRRTHGDECLASWEPLVATSHDDARCRFQEAMLPGRMAFRLLGEGQSEPITDFDPAIAGDVLIVPAIQGG